MSLNAWGGKIYEYLMPYLALERPDVLCLQEVVHSPQADRVWLQYRDGDHVLQQRANFFRDVAQILPDHVATFCPFAQGPLWDGDRELPSQFGLATFVHKDLPVIGQVQGFVHKEFSPNGYGDHPRARCAHGVRVYVEGQEQALSILQTHGMWDPRGKIDTPERRQQALSIAGLVRTLAKPEDGLIVCGDLNVLPDSETFEILAQLGLRDLVTGEGITSTRTSLYDKDIGFADYMLVNDAVAFERFDVVTEPEVSDHCPLVLHLAKGRATAPVTTAA